MQPIDHDISGCYTCPPFAGPTNINVFICHLCFLSCWQDITDMSTGCYSICSMGPDGCVTQWPSGCLCFSDIVETCKDKIRTKREKKKLISDCNISVLLNMIMQGPNVASPETAFWLYFIWLWRQNITFIVSFTHIHSELLSAGKTCSISWWLKTVLLTNMGC